MFSETFVHSLCKLDCVQNPPHIDLDMWVCKAIEATEWFLCTRPRSCKASTQRSFGLYHALCVIKAHANGSTRRGKHRSHLPSVVFHSPWGACNWWLRSWSCRSCIFEFEWLQEQCLGMDAKTWSSGHVRLPWWGEPFTTGVWQDGLTILELSDLNGIESNEQGEVVRYLSESFLRRWNKCFRCCSRHSIVYQGCLSILKHKGWESKSTVGKKTNLLAPKSCGILTQNGDHHLWGQDSLNWKTLPNLPKQKKRFGTRFFNKTLLDPRDLWVWNWKTVHGQSKLLYIKLWLATPSEGL